MFDRIPAHLLKLELRTIWATLVAGIVIGIMQTAQAASFAALVFSGELVGELSRGVGLALFAAATGLLVVAFMTSMPVMVGGIQTLTAPILAVVAAAIAVSVSNDDQRTATIIAAIALSTLLAGLALYGIGALHLARLVRFLPYPVVGGFLAGTGWLFLTGSVSSLAEVRFNLFNPGALFQSGLPIRWVPGLLLGIVILLLSRRIKHFLFLPGAIIVTSLAFFAVALALGQTMSSLSAGGHLLGPFPQGGMWQPLLPAELRLVSWSAVWQQMPNMLAAVTISGISLLLNVSALEISLGGDVDMDREMRAAGASNIVAGAGGGAIGFHQMGLTTLNAKMGQTSRAASILAAAFCAAALFFGAAIIGYIPKLALGALLSYLGLGFLQQWVVEARYRLPRIDYAIVILILVVIALTGFLQGVIVGTIATVIMFIVNYSGVDVVKHSLTAQNYHSRVVRPPQQRALLDEHGNRARILQLRGFLFFGTAHGLLERTRRWNSDSGDDYRRYLLLDFSGVTGLDTTAILSFNRIRQLAESSDLTLCIAGRSEPVSRAFSQGGFTEDGEVVRFFDSPDRALEWIEEQILLTFSDEARETTRLHDQLLQLTGNAAAEVHSLLSYLTKLNLDAGQLLMRRGDAPDALYLVESGQVTAQITRQDGTIIRLETMMSGRVIGELGFYLARARSADVVAEIPSIVYRLDRESLARMEKEDPAAASTLHQAVIRLLADRVTHLVDTVEALQR